MDTRKINREELNQIEALEQVIFSDSWSLESLTASFLKDNALFLCCVHNEEIVGYVIAYFAAEEGEIIRIAVKPGERRKGIGGHLLLGIEDFCEQYGIEKLFLEVRESNEAAIAFYEEYGFKNVGLRKDYYSVPNEDAIVMSRELETDRR